MEAELLYMEMCANFNFVFLELSHQPLKHQDLSEIQNKKEGFELLAKSFDQASLTVDGESISVFL